MERPNPVWLSAPGGQGQRSARIITRAVSGGQVALAALERKSLQLAGAMLALALFEEIMAQSAQEVYAGVAQLVEQLTCNQ